jgi:protein arginine kinase activator
MQGPLSIADILSNLGPEDDESLEDRSKSCSFCRITLGEFKRTSRLGCPVCYESFKKETETVVDGYQHASKHAGKMPAHYAANREKEAVLDPLRRTLQEAIAAEQYEEAARIRDEIRLEETKG